MSETRPVLIAHTADHMDAAFAAAETTARAITVRSAEGAAGTIGAGVFVAMVADARATHPNADVRAVLDCADDAGAAMNAIRQGVDAVRLDAPADVAAKIAEMAADAHVHVDTDALPVLDLLGEPEAEAAAIAWIETAD